MCGIVGFASGYHNGFTGKEMDVFYEMLFYDQLRGWDSTGVFGADKYSNVVIHKMADHASNFFQTPESSEFRKEMVKSGLFAVGHNRAATRGDVVDKNAHPFWVDDKIVLVQNGTWRGSHKHHHDTEVDSEALAKIIAHEPSLEEAFGKIQASFALCWFNTEEHTLNLIRNHERPLYIAQAETGGLIWCSEAGFITQACNRQDLKLKEYPTLLEPFTLVKLHIEKANWKKEELKITPNFPKIHLIPGPTQYPGSGNGGTALDRSSNWNNYRHNGSREAVDKTTPDILFERFPEYIVPRGKALEVVEAVHLHNGTRPRHVIEVTNYEAANTNPMCSTWHIWGTLIVPDDPLIEKAVCHFFWYNVTEEEVKKLINKVWWEGKIVAVRSNIYNDKNAVVTVFMNEMKPFEMETILNVQPS